MRVVIIGAGVGGLCLAQGLLQAGIDVRVCERDPAVDSRYQGFRIGLGGTGLDSLLECLPSRLHPLLHATTGSLDGSRRIVDTQLNPVGELEPMHGGIATDRRVLRQVLLGGLDKIVEFGRDLSHYTELADGTVRASFTDGSTTTADLLVGADGVNSAVRRQLLPHASLGEAGFGGVLGRTTLDSRFESLVPGFGTIVRGETATMMLGLMRFRRPPRQAAADLAPDVDLPDTTSYVRWVLGLPPHLHATTDPRMTVLDLIDGWHPLLTDLVEHADTVANLGRLRYAEPIQHWGTHPITLLGDAIHVMPPSGGLGANTAFLDAATLTRELSTVHTPADLLPAVERYEHTMLDHGFGAIRASLTAIPQFLPAKS